MRGRTAGAVLITAVALAACGEGGSGVLPPPATTTPTPSTSTSLAGVPVHSATFEETPGEQPTGFVVEEGLVEHQGNRIRLSGTPSDRLAGSLVPWVVPAPDGSVYYTTWEEGRNLDELEPGEVGGIPTIRRATPEGDELYRSGAYAPTVSADGRLAFVEDLDGAYRYSVPNPNRIVVVEPDGREEVWTPSGSENYVTVGWAGSTLIAYQRSEGGHIDTYALTGPDDRTLLSGGGVVVAISPDGTRILLVEDSPSGTPSTWFALADTTGRRLDEAAFDTESGPIQGFYLGDWRDGRVVTAPGAGDGVRTPYVFGFAVLSVTGDTLALERFVQISLPDMISVTDPRFTTEGDVWIRTAFAPAGQTYKSQDWTCHVDRALCRSAAERGEYVAAPSIVRDIGGGSD